MDILLSLKTTRKEARLSGELKYFTNKPCKNGHLTFRRTITARCNDCDKMWVLNNKAKHKIFEKNWRNKNREYDKSRKKKWTDSNRERINKNRMIKYKERMKVDVKFRITKNLRGRLYTAITKFHKSKSAIFLLGCTIEYFMDYMKIKFVDGMSWDNYGEWEIDHIRPCASFDLTDVGEQLKCFHYTNLQPLWMIDNIIKKDKWDGND